MSSPPQAPLKRGSACMNCRQTPENSLHAGPAPETLRMMHAATKMLIRSLLAFERSSSSLRVWKLVSKS
ncbi:hypothetical protein B0H11DRAFT_2216976 [Mycena galericulata]|nr:hypothetical protein B0H11DRAFT_2216976 [Mycena galericulata]